MFVCFLHKRLAHIFFNLFLGSWYISGNYKCHLLKFHFISFYYIETIHFCVLTLYLSQHLANRILHAPVCLRAKNAIYIRTLVHVISLIIGTADFDLQLMKCDPSGRNSILLVSKPLLPAIFLLIKYFWNFFSLQ